MSGLLDHLNTVQPTGVQTVPDALIGCWRRNWIRFGEAGAADDPVTEDHVEVIWLQTASGMGDVRIDPTRPIETTDSSCGITVVDESTQPHMTADWADGDTGFTQQPVPSFPEKGWLVWDSASIMHELAPSGAYVEQWERLDGSGGTAVHLVATNAASTTNLYVAGSHVFYAARSTNAAEVHEFSYARITPTADQAVIELSTRSDRVGQPLTLDVEWHTVSCRHLDT